MPNGQQNEIEIIPVQVVNQWPPTADPIMAKLCAAFMLNQIWMEQFVYSATWAALGASAVGSGPDTPIAIDPQTDFIVTQMNLCMYSAANTVVANPDLLLQVTEQNGRGVWFNQATHVALVTGQSRNSGSMPKWTSAPRYVRGTNTLQTALTNLGGVAGRVDLSLEGYRITYLTKNRTELLNVPQ